MNRNQATATAGPCALAMLGVALLAMGATDPVQAQDAGCAEGARLLRYACEYDLQEGFHNRRASCLDSSAVDPACTTAAETLYDEEREECDEVLSARLDLCESVDDAIHDPGFGEAFAANFVDPLTIGAGVTPNPWFPLVQGNTWVYEGTSVDDDGEEVTETITVTVTGKVKMIEGIRCLTVTDIVTEEGELIEDTDDWFAQDTDGNVWYCGEIAENFESFDGDDPGQPELVDIDGSWKSGRDGARAGMLLPFAPEPGSVIRQEVLYGDAEDAVEILSITATEAAPGGNCTDNCLQTRDFTPLEPDAQEHKFYAPGTGLIVELDPETGDRVELIDFQGVGS